MKNGNTIELGKKIDLNLSDRIRRHTDRNDRIQIASRFGVTEYDLKNIIYVTHNVKQRHMEALKELIRRAKNNADESSLDAEFLNNYL